MLLKTKFLAPAYNPKSVDRSRLTSRLDSRHGRKLTSIVAPAGYGKTTLVTQWIHSEHISYSWLSLDEADNEPRQFWQYIIGTLDHSFDCIGSESVKLLNDKQAPIEASVTALVNELCIFPFVSKNVV